MRNPTSNPGVLPNARLSRGRCCFYAYSPYGQATSLGPDGGNSLQYTGRENDGTGLYFYRARYYDPMLKWISDDPIGLAGGINQRAYVGGNPISNTDPMGLQLPSQTPPKSPHTVYGPFEGKERPIDKWLDRAVERGLGIPGVITKNPVAVTVGGVTYATEIACGRGEECDTRTEFERMKDKWRNRQGMCRPSIFSP